MLWGSSGALFINNKMNNDISNISGNDTYGNINVTMMMLHGVILPH